jgi:hypothetical protein
MLAVGATFLVAVWIWLVVVAANDLLRRDDLSPGRRAAWGLGLVALPYAGVLAYIASQGAAMAERRRAPSEELRRSLRAMAVSATDELAKLEGLHARKAISPSEYDRLRSRLLE